MNIGSRLIISICAFPVALNAAPAVLPIDGANSFSSMQIESEDSGAWPTIPSVDGKLSFRAKDSGLLSGEISPISGEYSISPISGNLLSAPNRSASKNVSAIDEATFGRLRQRYLDEDPQASDLDFERLFQIADGVRGDERPSGVSLVSGEYEAKSKPRASIPQDIRQPTPPQLDGKQIAALIMALTAAQRHQPAARMPNPMEAIPGLDYRGDVPSAGPISPEDIPAGTSPFSPELLSGNAASTLSQIIGPSFGFSTARPAAIVGDGSNLILRGWKIGLTGSGGIGLYIDGDPASIVEIREGSIVGQAGQVEKISFQNGEIIADFSSGESVRGPAQVVMSSFLSGPAPDPMIESRTGRNDPESNKTEGGFPE